MTLQGEDDRVDAALRNASLGAKVCILQSRYAQPALCSALDALVRCVQRALAVQPLGHVHDISTPAVQFCDEAPTPGCNGRCRKHAGVVLPSQEPVRHIMTTRRQAQAQRQLDSEHEGIARDHAASESAEDEAAGELEEPGELEEHGRYPADIQDEVRFKPLTSSPTHTVPCACSCRYSASCVNKMQLAITKVPAATFSTSGLWLARG